MFTVKSNFKNSHFFIRDYVDARPVYLHCDGGITNVCEYFETAVAAQKVLDKFQPKHEWKHGDVFENKSGTPMLYIKVYGKTPQIFCAASCDGDPEWHTNRHLDGAKFLFNIKEKMQ